MLDIVSYLLGKKAGGGGGGGGQLPTFPTLNTPSITFDAYTSKLTVTDGNNGNFTDGYEIYLGDNFITTITGNTVVLLDITAFVEGATIKARSVGEGFNGSDFATEIWNKPNLYAPTITIDNITDTITITDTNGTKTKEYAVYANGVLLTTTTEKSVVLSTYMELTESQGITVKAISNEDYFVDSKESVKVVWFVETEGTEGLKYNLNSGSCLGMGTATDTDITIGSVKDGKVITQIYATAFQSTSITSVVIPDSIVNIGESAFNYCSNLASVTIGRGVTYFGDNAFIGCNNITAVYISDLQAWCGITIYGNNKASPVKTGTTVYLNGEPISNLVIPDGVTAIKNFAFNSWSITSVTIPEGVTSIGYGAFAGCSNLASVTIPEGVTSIEGLAFSGCSNLTSVTIPEGVTSIGEKAFYSCSNLASVTIGRGVTSIGDSAFYSCSNLTSVTIPEGVTSINNLTFASCSNLASVTIPDSVTSIGQQAFASCKKLTSLTIGRGVTSINATAFSSTLKDIYVPWAEGEVAYAPWGAKNATIHYNSEV